MCLGTKASIKEEEQGEIHSDLKAVVKALLIKEFSNASAYLKIQEFIQNSDLCCVIWLYFCNAKCFCIILSSSLVPCIHKSVNTEFWTRTS